MHVWVLLKTAFLGSLSAIEQSPRTLLFWFGTVLIATAFVWLSEGRSAVIKHITRKVLLTAGVVVLAWLPVFVWHLGYVEKELQDAMTTQQKDNQIASLTTKLGETCFVPARHFTQEQKKLVYLALRDLAAKTARAHKRLFIGSVRGDVEAQRFIQFSLYPAFTNAGWNIAATFDRPMRKKDTDLVYPGSQEGLNISYTAEYGTAEYKWQNELTYGIIGAFHQAEIEVNEGVVTKGDPLKMTNSLVIWVAPQRMTSQYQY